MRSVLLEEPYSRFWKPCLRSSPIIPKSALDDEILDFDPESDATMHDTSQGS